MAHLSRPLPARFPRPGVREVLPLAVLFSPLSHHTQPGLPSASSDSWALLLIIDPRH